MLAFLYFIVTVFLPGLAIGLLLRKKITALRIVAIAYGIGTALIAFELFLYFVIFRLTFSPFLFWFFGVQALIALAITVKYLPWKEHFSFDFKKIKPLSYLLALVIAVLLFFSAVQALGKPPVAFDSVAFWAMRAEILLKDGHVNFDPQSLTYLSGYNHHNYPWHLSFMEYWLRTLGATGGVVNLIAWSYFLSLILLLSDFLIKRLGQVPGLFFVLLCATQPLIFYHASNNYADLIIGYYIAIAVAFFLEWLDNSRLYNLLIAASFFSWTICIKNYGVFYIISFVVAFALALLTKKYRLSLRSGFYFTLAFILPALPLGLFKIIYHLNLRNSEASYGWHPEIFKPLWQALFVSNNWNVWWAIFIGLMIFLLPTIKRDIKLLIPWVMFITTLLITVAVFVLTENYQWALDQTSASRAFIPLVPFSILLIGFSLSNYSHKRSV